MCIRDSGYEAVTKQVVVEEGRLQALSLTLRRAAGTIRVVGMPRRAVAYLDDRVVDVEAPLSASAGEHRVRLELDQTVLVSWTVDVQPGAEAVLDVTERPTSTRSPR